uniref:hypothetical protein n=1 Tax=Halobacterium salinarum TaxID=2242 RepID=UPI001F466C33
FAPRFRLSVGTLVTHGKGGILSLNQDRRSAGAPDDLLEAPVGIGAVDGLKEPASSGLARNLLTDASILF